MDVRHSCLENSLQPFFLVVRIFAATSFGSYLWPVISPCMNVSLRNEVWLLENLFTVPLFFKANPFFQFCGIRHSNGCGCLNKFGLLWLYLMNIFYFRFVSQCLVVLFILWSPESKCLCTFPYFWNMHKQSGSGQEYILILSLLISKSLYIASASILETSSLLSFATST